MPEPVANEHGDRRTRQRLLEAAVGLLARDGLRDGLLERCAHAAGCSPERARVFFRRDEELILALYARFAADLEARVLELPEGTVAERFHAVMRCKLDLITPSRDALAALAATALDPRHELGALHPQTEVIRNRVRGVFAAAVQGATDRPAQDSEAVIRLLYGTHLALLLLWCQDRSSETHATTAALDLVRDLLRFAVALVGTSDGAGAAQRLDGIFQPLLEPGDDPAVTEQAEAVLRTLFRHRRLGPTAGDCATHPCPQCLALHLPKVKYFLRAGRPIHFLLPAFPAKSPSRRKTLGPLPDRAEELALAYLAEVAVELRALYPPGVRLTICSDGHVFSDLVGVSDEDVAHYRESIRALLPRTGGVLDTFDMTDLYEGLDFPAMREHLVAEYALPLEQVEERAHRFEHAAALVNGIHRFLFEEQADLQPHRSRTSVRQECRGLAYRVVQRSEAWGRLLADCFPTALRLSIHPQHPHAEKIGILLGPADDPWLTPWHGVALRTSGGWRLVRRDAAEALGGRVVMAEGRPSYFELAEEPVQEHRA
jgi:pyoverdine/dityrosine biosynthesis protein Dit1/AcrR family transcriptional regulator